MIDISPIVEIRKRHESALYEKSYISKHIGSVAHKDRGILLDMLKIAAREQDRTNIAYRALMKEMLLVQKKAEEIIVVVCGSV